MYVTVCNISYVAYVKHKLRHRLDLQAKNMLKKRKAEIPWPSMTTLQVLSPNANVCFE